MQWALPVWLADRGEIQGQIRRRVTANLAELDRQLATAPTLERLAVEGGWYAVLRVPALGPDEQTVLALLERGVWAVSYTHLDVYKRQVAARDHSADQSHRGGASE